MAGRATGSASARVSPQSGNVLAYDNEGQLASWQSGPLGGSTGRFLYDDEGQRVQQAATTSGTTTTTSYIGSLEEVNVSGSTTTTTAYYGKLALSVNGALSYTLSDNLGSVSERLNASGVVTATQLYSPYGALRYTSGALPTSYGYTHQRSDATSGLDYYGARYYDPVAGQFTSADPLGRAGLGKLLPEQQTAGTATDGATSPASAASAAEAKQASGFSAPVAEQNSTRSSVSTGSTYTLGSPRPTSSRSEPSRAGLNLYAYVNNNPETLTDPTGKFTVGTCASVGVGAGVGVSGQACYVGGLSADGKTLSLGTTETGAGQGYAGITAGGTVGIQASNANSVNDLRGPFVFGGFGFEIPFTPLGVQVSWFTGTDSKGHSVWGGGVEFGLKAGASANGGLSYTAVQSEEWNSNPNAPNPDPVGEQIHQQLLHWLHQVIDWPIKP